MKLLAGAIAGIRAGIAAQILLAVAVLAQSGPSADFAREVAPVLEQGCAVCHNPEKPAGGIDVTSRKVLLEKRVIVPGKPEASPLYKAVMLPPARPGAMPPGGPQLPAAQRDLVRRWIEQGAVWPEAVRISARSTAGLNDEREAVRLIHRRIQARSQADSKMASYSVTIPNTLIAYSMAPIPAGDFMMGSPASNTQSSKDEQPQHKVHVDAFWMQTHEVTWDEYRLFMFANQAGETAHKDAVIDAVSRPTRPYVEMSFGMGINGFPAISMTQHAANKYAEWLSAKTGEFYRLPTEAEWEYACRAGSFTSYPFGAEPSKLGEYAWYSANSEGKYQKVAEKKPNAWGLYDMLGNVMEWTLDQYGPYQSAPQSNPWVVASQPYPHAVRGGSWNDPASALRCAARIASDPSWKQQDPQLPKSIWYETDAQWLGFRLVRPAKTPTAEAMYQYWNSGVEHDEQ